MTVLNIFLNKTAGCLVIAVVLTALVFDLGIAQAPAHVTVSINDATIVEGDLQASNGVIHGIDVVLTTMAISPDNPGS